MALNNFWASARLIVEQAEDEWTEEETGAMCETTSVADIIYISAFFQETGLKLYCLLIFATQ